MVRRVDGFAVHAVMVGGKIIPHESGAATDHRADGGAVHPTAEPLPITAWTAEPSTPHCYRYVYAASAPAACPLAATWRFTADSTDLNDAVTILLSMPTPNKVGPSPTRSST